MKEAIKKINNTRLMKFIYTIVPQYALIPLLMTTAFNSLVYNGARFINEGTVFNDYTSSLDLATPFVPQFILIYVLAFPFWAISYIMIARESREVCYRLVCANIIAKLICGAIFLLIPTTNVRPELGDSGLWNWGMNLLYQSDKADNLFPSIHCLESWFCFAGIRSSSRFSKGYKAATLAMALAICASTVLIRQHIWIDVISGVLIAEVMWRSMAGVLNWRTAKQKAVRNRTSFVR